MRGDVVLCEVTGIGQHKFLAQRDGARNKLFVGDQVLLVYGARYAPDQFEAELPEDLGPCHLAAAGGIASRVVSRHASMADPTAVRPLGLVVDESEEVINLRSLARRVASGPYERPPVIAVLGTSMNAGKTTAVASLVRGLTRAGRRVGAAKVTGTGSPNDPGLMAAAGAACVMDFTDLGHPSTYQLDAGEVAAILRQTIEQLASDKVDVAVLEIADGILQPETAALVEASEFRDGVDRVVFAAGDAVSAVAGARMLTGQGVPVVAVSGLVTTAPLAVAEATRLLDIPVLSSGALADPAVASSILAAPDVPREFSADRVPGGPAVLTSALDTNAAAATA
ncbi:DUF1611 domain-containing protein [Streptomyces sp. BK340]|uniref:DUF1611 domain-containing protein n=1 Tax=Streptomyces sp. BK340 TaxID=2572903 RepID=UPI0011A2F503|nr:DUF1611 domain-containing protein [Streptomyces sp. BK340]TVZ76752.1 hypothetical protein FB157_14232 [Streptomyces sp. BK340]